MKYQLFKQIVFILFFSLTLSADFDLEIPDYLSPTVEILQKFEVEISSEQEDDLRRNFRWIGYCLGIIMKLEQESTVLPLVSPLSDIPKAYSEEKKIKIIREVSSHLIDSYPHLYKMFKNDPVIGDGTQHKVKAFGDFYFGESKGVIQKQAPRQIELAGLVFQIKYQYINLDDDELLYKIWFIHYNKKPIESYDVVFSREMRGNLRAYNEKARTWKALPHNGHFSTYDAIHPNFRDIVDLLTIRYGDPKKAHPNNVTWETYNGVKVYAYTNRHEKVWAPKMVIKKSDTKIPFVKQKVETWPRMIEKSTNIHFSIEYPEITQILRQKSLSKDAAKL